MPLLDPAHYWHISRLLSCCSGHDRGGAFPGILLLLRALTSSRGAEVTTHTAQLLFQIETIICKGSIQLISSITWYIYLERYKIPPVGCAAAVAGVQGDWAGQCDRVSGDLAWPGRGARSSLLQTPSPSGTQPWYQHHYIHTELQSNQLIFDMLNRKQWMDKNDIQVIKHNMKVVFLFCLLL